MSKVLIIGKKQIQWFAVAMLVLMVTIAFLRWEQSRPASTPVVEERVLHMVTGEFKTKTASGEEIEVYRFDPGTVFANEGEHVKLSIFGVNGATHSFVIEGLNIRGEVHKGKETVVEFTAKEGIYRIVCLTHPGGSGQAHAHDGKQASVQTPPMIGYIVVD
ncbi:cupredoxin domain-containing protein [Paenibacillus sp. MSJ-34]|uniref:cupredoxin domain-containing protein n=2 Tax=unclassified Paenibacillus TaxID=185978 RepID=UPI00209DBA27|nr:cupredoxin domain-containing protein [Paenibacillus sp. MSJ-34]